MDEDASGRMARGGEWIMQLVDIDVSHNRVHITLSETFQENEAMQMLDEITIRLKELQNGFLVLCDLTALKIFEHDARRVFREIMDLCNRNGVGKVIRIVPDPLNDFGLTVLSHFHYDHGVPVITFRTLDEAKKHLHAARKLFPEAHRK